MRLTAKQAAFTDCLGLLLTYASVTGQRVILAEAFRPPELAALYAEQGRGIAGSVHTKKLAVDLFRYVGGTVSWDCGDYAALGAYWKSLHADARWGGDFESRDCVHFSFEHRGVQ